MYRFVAGCVLSLFATTGFAATETDRIRALLDSGDIAGLESSFSELYEAALAEKDFSGIRETVFMSMATTHEDRIETINSWNEAYPHSPFAKVAAAQMHMHIAFLYRGTKSSALTTALAMAKFREEITLSMDFAEGAFLDNPEYLPGSDLVIALSVASQTDLSIDDVVGHVFNHIPNRKTLKNALYAAQPSWGGSIDQMLDLCATFAEKIPGYDTDLCIVDAVLENEIYGGGELRNIALQIAVTRLDELSPNAQLNALIDPIFPISDESAKRAAMLHENLLFQSNKFSEFGRKARHLERKFSWPGYQQQAHEKRMAYIASYLEEDPYNNTLLRALINDILYNGSYQGDGRYVPTSSEKQELLRLWNDRQKYGQFRPEFWESGGRIAQSTADTGQKAFVAFPYYSNAISMSPWPQSPLARFLYLLHNDFHSIQRQMAQKNISDSSNSQATNGTEFGRCEYMRAAKLLQAYCENTNGQSAGCYSHDKSIIGTALKIKEFENQCPDVAQASAYDLKYSTIPLVEFGNWALE